jgi:hypothetical protein
MRWPKFTAWAQPGGLTECPYFRRWILDLGSLAIGSIQSIRLHKWYADDDHRAPHDHPQWFFTIVLWGGYDDVSYYIDAEGRCWVKDVERMYWLTSAYRPAEHLHSVQNVVPGTVTLLFCGAPSRRWGFWFGGKLLKRDKYFAVHGHHPCDPADAGVRLKPDGTRI